MSASPHEKVDESDPLNGIPEAGDAQNNDTRIQICNAFCNDDPYHRKLAICSIICGISCIGIKALIHSVKAEMTTDPEKATEFLNKAKKNSIISIVTLVSILAAIPILMALISYLLTLHD